MKLFVAGIGVFLALFAFVPSDAHAATCESLAELTLDATVIAGAETVAAGAFVAPLPPARAAGPGGRGQGAAVPPSFADLPAFCRVRATVRTSADSTIRIEVWMPVDGWNQKFLTNGYSFFGSTMNPTTLAGPLRNGYATAITDNGLPQGAPPADASFLRGHPERVVDWGERAWHETVVKAKALIVAFYGRQSRYSFFNGAGGAGRQGLKAAQRFPEDFDGIVVGGVAADSTHFSLANLWAWLAANESETAKIPAAKLPVIHKAAVAACDLGDGAPDGLIGDPERCRFDPAVLQCSATDSMECLTSAQVAAVRKLYAAPAHARTGRRLFGPLMPGSELGWSGVIGEQPNAYAVEFFRSIVFQDPAWDPRMLNFDSDVERAERVHPSVNAIDPDLRPFFGRGGKLIMYGGWGDTAINPSAQTDYYANILETAGTTRTGASARLFMIPMMGHFLGGTGAHSYELDTQRLIEEWVEKDRAPGPLVSRHRSNGVEDRTVLLCPYPQIAT